MGALRQETVAIKAESLYRGCNYTLKTASHFLLKHVTVESGKTQSIKTYLISLAPNVFSSSQIIDLWEQTGDTAAPGER